MHSINDKAPSSIEHNNVFLTNAMQIAKLGHCVFDITNDQYESVSEEYAQILGYTAEEFMVHFKDFVDDLNLVIPEDREALEIEYEEITRTGKSYDTEYRIRRKDGKVRTIREIGEVIADDNNGLKYSLCLIQDITESKQAQIAIHERKER